MYWIKVDWIGVVRFSVSQCNCRKYCFQYILFSILSNSTSFYRFFGHSLNFNEPLLIYLFPFWAPSKKFTCQWIRFVIHFLNGMQIKWAEHRYEVTHSLCNIRNEHFCWSELNKLHSISEADTVYFRFDWIKWI